MLTAVVSVPVLAVGPAGVEGLDTAAAAAGELATGHVECGWRITAAHTVAEIGADPSPRARQIHQALLDVGADQPGFVPAQCHTGNGAPDGSGTTGSGGPAGSSGGPDDSGTGDGTSAPTGGASGAGGAGGGADGEAGAGAGAGAGQQDGGPTAAAANNWGPPTKVDTFDSGTSGWNLYDGPGHAGNGTRSPSAVKVSGGLLTITGTGDGTTDGMSWGDGQKYGRWEGRMRAPVGSASYNALFLLWPDAENFPSGGEIDFAEITDHARRKVNLFLHYGGSNDQVHGDVGVDATQWHNWAVEWTPKGVTTFLDGNPWWHTTDTSILPPGPMHLCIQLDWFPRGDHDGGQMQVDWVKQWSLNPGATPSGTTGGSAGDGPSTGDTGKNDGDGGHDDGDGTGQTRS